MSTVLKHSEDDGDLSIIATDSAVLVVCSLGHYWEITAKLHNVPKRGIGGTHLEKDRVTEFTDRYGKAAARIVGLQVR